MSTLISRTIDQEATINIRKLDTKTRLPSVFVKDPRNEDVEKKALQTRIILAKHLQRQKLQSWPFQDENVRKSVFDWVERRCARRNPTLSVDICEDHWILRRWLVKHWDDFVMNERHRQQVITEGYYVR
ncbi:hypothetical protein BDA99DRAFT_541652 [Phascolomyces articulosus]|uniref:Uncharacterized protein n=1 Tax=Phascolomyces articulosus TaxID=60185 RepID=A0AAD5P9R0_9FUNG|nr:hypothetical protein BDA99DRAFT_541652 [Phascolomyces articulosus]